MKKILITAAATLAAISATAQNSSSTTNQSTTTAEAVAPKKENPWGFSVMALAQRAAKTTDAHFDDATGSDQNDPFASQMDSEYHFKLSYKLKDGKTLKVNQRVFYSYLFDHSLAVSGGEVPSFGSTRVELNTPISSIGTGSSVTARLGLPTTGDAITDGSLGSAAAIVGLNWDLNPKISVGFTSYNGMAMYQQRKGLIGYYVDLERVRGTTRADNQARLAQEGATRDWAYFDNQVALTYNASDKVSLVQSFGYGFGLKDASKSFANFHRVTALWELSTEIDVQATKAVGLAAGLSQQIADMPGAADLNTGKGVFFSGYKYALYRPEETTMYLQANIVF